MIFEIWMILENSLEKSKAPIILYWGISIIIINFKNWSWIRLEYNKV